MDSTLPQALFERILAKLGFSDAPSPDLAGLNSLYAAYCGSVSSDNILKRIWFASNQEAPIPGGEPAEFFRLHRLYTASSDCSR